MQTIPLPNGAKVAIATTLATAIAVSAVSNANPAVATAAAHGLTDGDILLVSADGWSRLDGSVRRVANSLTGTFAYEGLNSTDTTHYPAGGGVGSVQEITGWTQIPKVTSFATSGGDAKTTDTSYLDYEQDYSVITGRNAMKLEFDVSYAPDSTYFAALK